MVLPFSEQPGTSSVLTTEHPNFWAATPHRSKYSIQKMWSIVVKNLLIYACKSAQEVIAALFNAERIIKYSVIFSAVTMPTNCPA